MGGAIYLEGTSGDVGETKWEECAVPGCINGNLDILPKEFNTQKEWQRFISGEVLETFSLTLGMFLVHFSEDSFLNFGPYQLGFTTKLILSHGAVPSFPKKNQKAHTLSHFGCCWFGEVAYSVLGHTSYVNIVCL